jgi:CBS domain-containing protein
MKTARKKVNKAKLVLAAETAKDLMTPNPVSISETASIREAAVALTEREVGAFPVINAAGRPVGVVSRVDLVREQREDMMSTYVREIMTPTVVSVAPTDPAGEVVTKMTAFKIHRLFVVDGEGVLVGVISAFDIVRKLQQA